MIKHLLLLLCIITVPLMTEGQDQADLHSSFDKGYAQFIGRYLSADRVDYARIPQESVQDLASLLKKMDLESIPSESRPALMANAYNLLVIEKVVEHYPLSSISSIPDFFEKKMDVMGLSLSLNELEEKLLSDTGDPYMHLLLVCGAKSCPPLQYIDEQVPMSYYLKEALASESMLSPGTDGTLGLSQIFSWYEDQFGGQQALLENLMEMGVLDKLPEKVDLLDYDWALNGLDLQNHSEIFFPTRLYRKGEGEAKIFNNYYTQLDGEFRQNFFSSFLQVLIGTDKNLNFGFDVKLRSVTAGDVSTFSALAFKNTPLGVSDGRRFARMGISGFGPRVKYCLLYTSPSPRDATLSRMPSSA